MGAVGASAIDAGSGFVDNDYCFACGSRNPLGLHLTFVQDGDCLTTRVTPLPHWQGWVNVVHGGLQATIMDDLMSNHLFKLCQVHVVTASIELRFRRPVPLDSTLLFSSRLLSNSGRLWVLEASCTSIADQSLVLSTAVGRFMEVKVTE